MKRCSFQSLTMLSLREKTARHVEFDPGMTVIRGENSVGKSCLIKSLYYTFGADPAQLHPKWVEAEVKTLIQFALDGKKYVALRDGRLCAVFDKDGKVIFSGTSVTKQIAPFYAEFFNFKLQLQSRTSEFSQATPPFMFLPFYMDQDASWNHSWQSFNRLQQFAKWRQDVAEYHAGVRPNEYYEAKSGLLRIRSELKVVEDRREVLRVVLKELQHQIAKLDFNFDISGYQKEIESLLIACHKLQAHEEALKRELVTLYNGKAVIEAQADIVEAAAKELSKDYDYALDKAADCLECPICGTEHQNSFAERFAIAKDEQRCKELLVELQADRSKHERAISEVKGKYSGASVELEETRTILNKKRGDVTLKQLIENQGKREARAILERDINRLNEEIGKFGLDIKDLEKKMARFTNKEHRAAVRDRHIGTMKRYLATLDVMNIPEKCYRTLHAKIEESGSEKPRALLAYYYSILSRIWDNKSSTRFPIVIDSPNEKDQDKVNWAKMLRFIKDEQPKDSQIVLGLVDNMGISLGGKVIDLKDKLSVLREADYQSISPLMLEYISAALNAE